MIESLQKLLGKRPLRSPTTVLINNIKRPEEKKNENEGNGRRVKLNQMVEVRTYEPEDIVN
jgi:hypothetical protein